MEKTLLLKRFYIKKQMKKGLLVLNSYDKAINATNKFIELIKDNASTFNAHILYIDPDCADLFQDSGTCFWMPYRELNDKLRSVRQEILDQVIEIFDQLNMKPVVFVEGNNSKDQTIWNYIQEKGPYDLIVMANNKSKFCRQKGNKIFSFKKQDQRVANVVCLL